MDQDQGFSKLNTNKEFSKIYSPIKSTAEPTGVLIWNGLARLEWPGSAWPFSIYGVTDCRKAVALHFFFFPFPFLWAHLSSLSSFYTLVLCSLSVFMRPVPFFLKGFFPDISVFSGLIIALKNVKLGLGIDDRVDFWADISIKKPCCVLWQVSITTREIMRTVALFYSGQVLVLKMSTYLLSLRL